jgi:LuxR family transcriptional regulator, maltose regulon positive regulatory protein
VAPYPASVSSEAGSIQPWIAMLRSVLGTDGIKRMRADAEHTLEALGAATSDAAAEVLLEIAKTLSADSANPHESPSRQPRLRLIAADTCEVNNEQMAGLRARTDALAPIDAWAASITNAELRVLPLLATHLTFREIGTRLHVSRNTIKTQAVSIYRKLSVSGRSAAIGRASELGLLGAEPYLWNAPLSSKGTDERA